MPEPDEEAVLVEMKKIEKDLAATAPPPPPAVTAPRRTSRTTTRTSACLDMIPGFRNTITEAIREEQEPEDSPVKIGTAVTTSPEEEPKTEAMKEDTQAEQQKPQESQEYQEPVHQEQEQEQVQAKEWEPQPQPEPVPEPEPMQNKNHQDNHLSYLSTRLSRRRSLIEIFNSLRASQRSSFRLNLEFSPKFYASPFSPSSPSSPTSSTTAVSPPMSPVSTISPLSPTLSDETIMVDAIETACAVQIGGRKGPQEVLHQGKEITPDENIFQFR